MPKKTDRHKVAIYLGDPAAYTREIFPPGWDFSGHLIHQKYVMWVGW